MKKCFTRIHFKKPGLLPLLWGFLLVLIIVEGGLPPSGMGMQEFPGQVSTNARYGHAVFQFLKLAAAAPTPQSGHRHTILVVDTHLRNDPSGKTIRDFIGKLKAIYPADYRPVFWSRYDKSVLDQVNPDFVVFSPQTTPWQNYPSGEYNKLLVEVKNTGLPMLGICGGHQLIALAFGGTVGPINPEVKGCKYPTSYDNCSREKGYLSVTVTDDPIFRGLKGNAIVWLNHAEEVKNLPKDFSRIASNNTTPVQAMRGRNGKIYGLQFHPERIEPKYAEGKIIIGNIFGIFLSRN